MSSSEDVKTVDMIDTSSKPKLLHYIQEEANKGDKNKAADEIPLQKKNDDDNLVVSTEDDQEAVWKKENVNILDSSE